MLKGLFRRLRLFASGGRYRVLTAARAVGWDELQTYRFRTRRKALRFFWDQLCFYPFVQLRDVWAGELMLSSVRRKDGFYAAYSVGK